jgi:chaperonin cofactor prefoldin
MDSLESRMESVEIRLKLVESEVTDLGERLRKLEEVTNGLLGSFVILMNQSEIRYNETKGRFELVDGRAGTHESNQANTDLRLTSLEGTVKEHDVALAELRNAG